ncbi:phage/plasmid primase, P4 family [Turicimonas muris]|uniref:phage/plasmid primase, P4 family n=9 Tax=Turicimonas muris TaxID=1796652 RepID=UPI0025A52349|nr:phage/plasmid primase, P4 family [Turicimonas muris]
MTFTNTFNSLGAQLAANGYLPIPIVPREKRAAIKDWTKYRFKAADNEKFSGCGVGILCGQGADPIIGIDADTKDKELLDMIAAKVMPFAPMLRVGNAPRVLYVCKAPGANFKKLTSSQWDDGTGLGKDSLHQVEFLGAGQQFVAYGIHKGTGKPYTWTTPWGTEPANEKASELKEISYEVINDIIRTFDDMCKSRGFKLAERASETRHTEHTTEPLSEFDVDSMRCKDIPLSKAKQLISYIDADSYKTWKDVGMALHLEYAGSEEALALWNEWSLKSSNYPEGGFDVLRTKWTSFKEVGKLRTALIGMPSIIAKSDEARVSIDNQMRAAAKSEFIAALDDCESEYEVETLVRKTSLSSSFDKEVYTGYVLNKLKAFGVKSNKSIIQSWFKKSAPSDYAYNELGLAERMRDTYKGGLKWDCVNGQGFVWNGCRWTKVYPEVMMCYARKTVESLFTEAAGLERTDDREKLEEFARQSSRPWVWENMIKAFKSFAEGDASVLIYPQRLNQKLRFFGVANGEIDLETGEFIKGDPAHMLTLHSPVKYDAQAECPYTKAKILEICSNDQGLADLVWTIFACAMTGRVKRLFPIFYGSGHNGKSALISIFRRIFGNGEEGYHVGVDHKTFLEGREGNAGGAREDILRLKDKRLAVLMESKEGARLNSAMVKQLTGDDAFTARAQYARNSVSFVPCCLPILVTNHRPIVDDQSEGMWDRLLPIHLTEEFGPQRADPRFFEKTEEELSGILNELIKYVLRYKKEGIQIPDRVRLDQAKYRTMSDPLSEFFEEYCIIDKNASEVRSALYKQWKPYAQESSVPIYQERKSWFFNALEERGFATYKKDGIQRIKGLSLKTSMEFKSLEEEGGACQ